MPSYVAYTNGLGTDESPVNPGDAVSRTDFDSDLWDYHIQHGNIVRAGGPHDPNVLAAQLEDEIPEDPKDRRIAELEASLALFTGRQPTPAPATHLSDLSDAAVEESASSAKQVKSTRAAPSSASA